MSAPGRGSREGSIGRSWPWGRFCTTRYVMPGDELRTLIGAASPG